MLLIPVILLFYFLLQNRNKKNTIFYFSSIWMVSIFPISIGLINYEYFKNTLNYSLTLSFFLLAFIMGAQSNKKTINSINLTEKFNYSEFKRCLPWAKFAMVISIVGTGCLVIDYFTYSSGLSDIASLREDYIYRNASTYAKIASVMTWASLYCFAFSLINYRFMNKLQFIWYFVPMIGFFLVSLLSAGRQTVFQILIFTLFIVNDNITNKNKNSESYFLKYVIIILSLTYMGYIATFRNDGIISTEKSEVITLLFNIKFQEYFEYFLTLLSASLRDTIVEFIAYFTSPIALLSVFLEIDFPKHTYGAMSLPFIFRQIEPITGISVIDSLTGKGDLLTESGVIGVGWTTGISSYLMDFGFIPTIAILFLQGRYTELAKKNYIAYGGFHRKIISTTMLTSAIYMPLLAPSSDNNLLFLLFFSIMALYFEKFSLRNN